MPFKAPMIIETGLEPVRALLERTTWTANAFQFHQPGGAEPMRRLGKK